jgi:hypothetical protein
MANVHKRGLGVEDFRERGLTAERTGGSLDCELAGGCSSSMMMGEGESKIGWQRRWL